MLGHCWDGKWRQGQKEKEFAGQKCFCLGRETKAGSSEIPDIPKLCLNPAGSGVGLFPQRFLVDLGTSPEAVRCREPVFCSEILQRSNLTFIP